VLLVGDVIVICLQKDAPSNKNPKAHFVGKAQASGFLTKLKVPLRVTQSELILGQ